jgi:hypothetical protein
VTTGLENHVVKLLTRFHSTLVMNYVSWFGLVVLYPEWTLKKCGLIIADTLASRDCVTKYVERGYALQRDVFELTGPLQEHVCGVDPYCPTTARSLYDGYCFVEPFEAFEFEFNVCERDMFWLLPVSCFFGKKK